MSLGYTVVSYQTSTAAHGIDSRIARIRNNGNFGDFRSVGRGVFELRFHFGPGYRVYYTFYGQNMVIMLGAGEKDAQGRDIQKAHEFAEDYRRGV